MTKDEALKLAIKELSQTALGDTPALKACKEALEQPQMAINKTLECPASLHGMKLSQPSVAELNDEYLHYTYVAGLTQPQYLNVYGYLENQNITFRQQMGMPYLGKIKLETNDD